METKTVSSRMQSLIVLFDMHTTYFSRVIEGISDEDAHNRLNTKANHVAWLVGSLVQERYELANDLGQETLQQSANELFKDHQGIKDGVSYPSLSVSDEKLNSTFEMMPGMTMTYYDLITFITYREANCIGQMALWRRLLGYDPMKYD